jgi:hypothetical protein
MFVTRIEKTRRIDSPRHPNPRIMRNGETNVRSLDINFHEKFSSVSLVFFIEDSILEFLRLRTLSSFLSLLISYLSLDDTCL